jgi:phage gp46-like protein
MTADLALFQPDFQNGIIGPADIRMDGANPLRDDGLYNAILIALLTDRRANDGDVLPHPNDPRGGHFSDVLTNSKIGSRLWLLSRSRLDETTLRLAKQYAEEALNDQIIEPGMAADIDVQVVARSGRVFFEITLTKPDDTTAKYSAQWRSMGL